MDQLDSQIKDAIDTLLKAKKDDASFWEKVSGSFITLVYVIYLKWQLSKKEAELGAAHAELANLQADAQNAVVAAQTEVLEEKRSSAWLAAQTKLETVEHLRDQLDDHAAAHAKRRAQIAALDKGDWAALNRLAGVA